MPPSCHVETDAPWNQAEDEVLEKYFKQYSNNWELIASSLVALKLGPYRTEWDCYARICQLKNQPVQAKDEAQRVPPHKQPPSNPVDYSFAMFIDKFDVIGKIISNRKKEIKAGRFLCIEA